MSVAKIERDIKLLETKLTELDTTIADPIERNESRKELEKKIKKLQRTKSQTEQLERERQELESLKSEFTFNGEESAITKEYETNYDDVPEIETTSVEQIPSISSKPNSEISTSDNYKKSKNPLIIGGVIGFLLLLGNIVAINQNNQSQIANYPENKISKPVEIQSSSLQTETPSSQSDRSGNISQNQYLSNSSSANSNSSLSTFRRKTVQNPITKQEAIRLVNQYLQAKSEILSPPFDRQIASDILTGKALYDVVKPDGSIDWLIENNAYYRYGKRNAKPLTLFWSDNNKAELDAKIYEEYYFYKNNKLAKSNKYSDDFNFKFKQENGVWKINDKSSKK